MFAFWVSILITLILKIIIIYFITNDLLECVANWSKIYKTQVGKDQMIKLEELLKIKREITKLEELMKFKNTRPSIDRSILLVLY